MKTKIEKVKENITALKEQLLELGPIHPGSLSMQVRKKNGESYGEYWHLSYTFAGKGRTMYINPLKLEEFRVMVNNFQTFKALSDKIIALSIDLAKLKMKSS